jgi:hypothetical protein
MGTGVQTRKVAELKRSDIEKWHAKISIRTATRANRALALLSTMLSLAVKSEWITTSPTRGVKKNPEASRERYLDQTDR